MTANYMKRKRTSKYSLALHNYYDHDRKILVAIFFLGVGIQITCLVYFGTNTNNNNNMHGYVPRWQRAIVTG